MAEIGGSPTDDSAINLDSTESGPSASNQPQEEGALSAPNKPQKEGALKRHADTHNDASAEKKKKKSAEELASSTKGRNVALKKELQKLKKEQRKQKLQAEEPSKIEKLKETRDRLVARLKERGEREMCMSDKAEEKALKYEEKLRKALITCEDALRNKGEATFDEDDQNVFKALSIHIAEWPCLDSHIQDFAYERLYVPHHQEDGVSLRKEDLLDIITKVKSREPTIGLPSAKDTEALERLLVAVNWKVVEAVHERRFEQLTKNLEQYPGVDPELAVEPLLKVKQEMVDERDELKDAVGRVMTACKDAAGSETGIELIELDDDDDEEKEGDDDELEDEEEEDDEDDEDLNFVRSLEKSNKDKKDKKDDDAMHGGPEMDPSENESMNDGSETNPTKNEGQEGQDKQTEDKTEKGTEDRPDSRDEKDTMAMEGGTSTNSPTLERDERMKELENIEDIKQDIIRVQAENSDAGYEEEEGEQGGEEDAPGGRNVLLAADTIVLDDDEEEGEMGEEKKPAEIKKEMDDQMAANGPPVPEKMTPTDAWRAKVREIQQWVNKLLPGEVRSHNDDQQEEEEEEVQLIEPVVANDEDDDDIVCDLDDFEMDSVSHSGLQLRRQKMQEEGLPVPPAVVPKVEKDDEVEVIELD